MKLPTSALAFGLLQLLGSSPVQSASIKERALGRPQFAGTCPSIGTIAAGATAPSPPAGVNVYKRKGNAVYTTPEADLLKAISFPNGFKCNTKLAILQPGTAVPAADTFGATFIPSLGRASNTISGGVDIMLVSNPSISLANAWKTAEYIAYAMDYAELVLNRPGTIIAWSQGNLNTQWAFKHWPTTRAKAGRNYVAMSADYDGTILADFLCQPLTILTSGSGANLANQFISSDGIAQILSLLGLSTIPSVNGKTDPQAFKALLLSLVYSDASVNGFGTAAAGSSSSSTTAGKTSTTSHAASLPTSVSGVISGITSGLTSGLTSGKNSSKRAVPFGDKAAVEAVLLDRMLEKRATGLDTAARNLLAGVLQPIANELANVVVNPAAEGMQIFANLAKLATPQGISLPPQGCSPGVWDQTYFSSFVQSLQADGGANAYVPTTSIFSLTDEVVEPQGVTGFENASGYMAGANSGVVAPSNILIQQHCSVISNLLNFQGPPIITHEGVLNSGMGVAAAVLAVSRGGTVTYDQVVAAYGATEACALISKFNTVADLTANEATIPGALLRVTVNPGTTGQGADQTSGISPVPVYQTN